MNIIEFGDCRETMRRWADDGVKAQMCVTSPPYFGLRDYGHDGQIGLEETPQQYIEAMVEVFRCVWDVLEDDGTLWLNLGDSYGRGKRVDNVNDNKRGATANTGHVSLTAAQAYGSGQRAHLREKCLLGIPWRVALALQDDGWYLRQDIIWHKPNPMPESVTDRCTKSHEYIFLLSKSERYYFDAEAIKEAAAYPNDKRRPLGSKGAWQMDGREQGENGGGKAYEHNTETRNRRSVWSVVAKPYEGAHFATYPEELIEPCVMAGSRVGDIVLDPFMGSGTTAQVAQDLGRQYIGCELNPAYKALQDRRTQQQSLVLA